MTLPTNYCITIMYAVLSELIALILYLWLSLCVYSTTDILDTDASVGLLDIHRGRMLVIAH